MHYCLSISRRRDTKISRGSHYCNWKSKKKKKKKVGSFENTWKNLLFHSHQRAADIKQWNFLEDCQVSGQFILV